MQADAKVLSNTALIYHIDHERWPSNGHVYDGPVIPGTSEDELQGVDEHEISDDIQALKGHFHEYAISVDGPNEGTVFHVEGVEDKEGNTHHSFSDDFTEAGN